MPGIVMALTVIACAVLLLVAARSNRQLVDRKLSGLAAAHGLLDEPAMDQTEGTVTGKWNGLPVVVRFALRSPGNPKNGFCTQIEVLLGEPSFAIEIRPDTPREEAYRARGLATDVAVGDPAFDDVFVVEAAPAAAAVALLDDKDLRDRLRALHPITFGPCPGGVRLQKDAWIDELNDMRRALSTAVDLASGIDAAALEAHVGRDASEDALTYRAPGARAKRDADERRQKEVNELAALKDKRREHEVRPQLLLGAVVLIVVVTLALWLLRR